MGKGIKKKGVWGWGKRAKNVRELGWGFGVYFILGSFISQLKFIRSTDYDLLHHYPG